MASISEPHPAGVLAEWAVRHGKMVPRDFIPSDPRTTCALLGRGSTKHRQDRAASEKWQKHFATELLDGRGHITETFFDHGVSRRVPWQHRPQAARLLHALSTPDRSFEAIVVGEYERAFSGSQLRDIMPLLQRHGIQLWLPEVGGPVDTSSSQQMALLDLLGVHAWREISRARQRSTAAMQLHARDGRYLGGRPPYGYQLADSGPHPNRRDTRDGRRLYHLETDPATSSWVQWIFAQRLTGQSLGHIARQLNQQGVPSPSAADPERNRHRRNPLWGREAIAAILSNPRYTGYEVWNRHPGRNHPPAAPSHLPAAPSKEHKDWQKIQGWTPSRDWIISRSPAHTQLVSEKDFVAVQQIRAKPKPSDSDISSRAWQLTGAVFCGICGRTMHAHWANGRPGYRCRHGNRNTSGPSKSKALYIREDQLLYRLSRTTRHTPTLRPLRRLLDLADRHAVTTYLREHRMHIVCRPGFWNLQTPSFTHHLGPGSQQKPLPPPAASPTMTPGAQPASAADPGQPKDLWQQWDPPPLPRLHGT